MERDEAGIDRAPATGPATFADASSTSSAENDGSAQVESSGQVPDGAIQVPAPSREGSVPEVAHASSPPEAGLSQPSEPIDSAPMKPQQSEGGLSQPSVPMDPPAMKQPESACLGRLADGVTCGCTAECAASNAIVSCVTGRCARGCDADFGDCNGDLARGNSGDGCETDLRTTDTRCGDCDTACTTRLGSYVACEDKQCSTLDVTPTPLVALGRCLDVRGPSDLNGTPVQIWSCGDRFPQQLWAFTAAGELRGFANKCLDVRGPSDDNGTPVQIWDCVRVPQQRWALNARGQLVGFNGKCLQVVAQTSEDGQAVELWDCQDIPAQRWTLSAP